jgi:hypothetical protein
MCRERGKTMKFTIVAYPSKFSDTGFNYLLIRVKDGATVGMIDECAVDDMKKILGMNSAEEVKISINSRQLRIPFPDINTKVEE